MITFKSRVTADVLMFKPVAHKLMEVIDKPPSDQGIVTAEQMPDAIARLRALIDQQRAVPADEQAQRLPNTNPHAEHSQDPREFVSLAQRAVPLLDMLERSLKADTPVVWGV